MLTAAVVLAGSAGLFGAARLFIEFDCLPCNRPGSGAYKTRINALQKELDDEIWLKVNPPSKHTPGGGVTYNAERHQALKKKVDRMNERQEEAEEKAAKAARTEALRQRMKAEHNGQTAEDRRRLTSHHRTRYTSPVLQRLLRATTTDTLLKSE